MLKSLMGETSILVCFKVVSTVVRVCQEPGIKVPLSKKRKKRVYKIGIISSVAKSH